MNKWVVRISRAFTMGLAWAAVWVPIGVVAARLIAGELDPEHIGGPLYAGFLCGTVFSAVAGTASGRHRLDELSSARAVACGALSGLLIGALPFVIGDQKESDRPLWVLPVVVMGALTLISAVSAGASAWLARMAKKGKWLDARTDVS
jgi:hypothetical protein